MRHSTSISPGFLVRCINVADSLARWHTVSEIAAFWPCQVGLAGNQKSRGDNHMAQPSNPAGPPPTKYVDRPDLSETFADHLEQTYFGDGVVKITMSAARWPEPKSGVPIMGERVTALRLAIPAKAAIALYNSLAQFIGVLEKQGLVTQQAPTNPGTKNQSASP